MEAILGSDPSINIIETYICPSQQSSDLNSSVFRIGWDQPPVQILNAFSKYPQQTVEQKEYAFRDLVFTFDLASDQQKLVSRHLKYESRLRLPEMKPTLRPSTNPTSNTTPIPNHYTIGLFEDVLPPHRYPCTTENTYDVRVTKTSYKINNRMHLIHELTQQPVREYSDPSHVIYIRYHHSPNVDLVKIQADYDKTLQIITRRVGA